MNFSPFIYAFEQHNVGITGSGTLDGNAGCAHWWPWKGRTECGWKAGDVSQDADRNRLFDMVERGVPVAQRVFGPGHYLRPMFIQPYRCTNVLVEGVTLLNYYEEADQGPFPPVVRNVALERVKMGKAEYALYLRGFANAPIRGVSVADCDFGAVAKPSRLEHVEGLTLRDVRVNGRVVDRL